MQKTFITLLVGAVISMAGCGATAPKVEVLEVAPGNGRPPTSERSDVVRVFLEVVNPSGSELRLSRLRYRFSLGDQLVARGDVALTRSMGAHTAAVIRVPVDIDGGLQPSWGSTPGLASGASAGPVRSAAQLSCSLDGRLFATVNRAERSWDIQTSCVVDASGVASNRLPVLSARALDIIRE